ncbi:hypothetical protein SB861_51425 [Paraburkholderia sp. SIMBA_049]
MDIARVVERDKQRKMLELEPVDEGNAGSVLAHGGSAVRFGLSIAQSQQRIEMLSTPEL